MEPQPLPDPSFFEPEAPFGFENDTGILNVAPADSFEGVSDDVEGLLYLGYLTHDFTEFGHSFTIRTLRRGERLAMAQIIREWDETIGLADALQTVSVAAAIVLVDGRPLSPPLGPDEEKNSAIWIRRNFQIVSRWFDPVIEAVYLQCSNLNVRQIQAFKELEGK